MSKMMETDAFTLDGYADEGEWREFARKLETQRDRLSAVNKTLVEALGQLVNACDTGHRNKDGTQQGVRVPEKAAVDYARAALKAGKV